MNKELINKYLNEFVHWKDGGSILVKYANPRDAEEGYEDWHEDDEVWNSNLPYLIIINDEYSHFRKALAESKTIQYRNINMLGFEKWEDLKALSFNPNFEYKIKPEEPKFEVGDWVKTADGTVIKLDWVDKPGVLSHLYDYGIFGKDNCKLSYQNEAIKWHPEPSEWCWASVFGLVKVLCETTENGNPCYLCWNPWKKAEQKLNNLEPFIGELPTFLKD